MLGETNILNIKNPLPILQTVSSPSFLEVSKSVTNPESQTDSFQKLALKLISAALQRGTLGRAATSRKKQTH